MKPTLIVRSDGHRVEAHVENAPSTGIPAPQFRDMAVAAISSIMHLVRQAGELVGGEEGGNDAVADILARAIVSTIDHGECHVTVVTNDCED